MSGKPLAASLLCCVVVFAQDSRVPGWLLAGDNPRAFEIGTEADSRQLHTARTLKITVVPDLELELIVRFPPSFAARLLRLNKP